jgi:nitrate/TMAO reductase-like tetraheme cytochrome c subunit
MLWAFSLPDLVTIVKVLGLIVCGAGVLICLRLATLRREQTAGGRVVRLGLVTLPAVAFYKLLALAGFLVVPPAAVGVAAYHVFEGTKETSSCVKCHVMKPMETDMTDPHSNTLAARHFRNKWIPEKQCASCHIDYGFQGSLRAKGDGFRHLARYTTETYHEPIVHRGTYNNANCTHCHGDAPKFRAVQSHATVGERLADNAMSCLNCHGKAHPSREQRTPGSKDYNRLMGKE